MNQTSNKGFSLVELLVAMGAASIIMAAVVSAYQLQVRGKNTQDALTDMNQTARAALEVMTHEIRAAGCDPVNSGSPGLPAIAGILIAGVNELSFTMDIGDGVTFEGDGDVNDPNERVRYAINANGHLGRDTGGGLQPLARNVDALDFVYLDTNGNVTGNLVDIRRIEVSLVARAGEAAGGFLNRFNDNTVYRNQRGTVILPAQNDSFRRLLLTTTINCYNLNG